MAKKAETAAETAEIKEKAEETVTISKADYEALLTDIKLMKKQFIGEQRLKSAEDRKLEEQEAERERILKANEKAEELVTVHIEMGGIRGKKNLEVSINGVQYLINRGVDVQVPRKVAEVIANSMAQREAAFGLQEQRQAEAQKALASGALTL